jgi:threonine/homoserine/homoserine lactone efflux protein
VDIVASLPAFLLAVVLISASPGPALALITRRAALQGARGALPTILGLEAGLYVWALLAGAGLAALVAASETAYLVLRVVGAIVLIGLGVRAWRAAWGDRTSASGATEGTGAPRLRRNAWFAFSEGAVVQLANPKAAVFMFAFYPQFVPADRPLLQTTAVLALLQVAVEICLYGGLALAIGRAGAWFRRRTIRRRLEAASGTVLIGLGVRMAVAER